MYRNSTGGIAVICTPVKPRAYMHGNWVDFASYYDLNGTLLHFYSTASQWFRGKTLVFNITDSRTFISYGKGSTYCVAYLKSNADKRTVKLVIKLKTVFRITNFC